MSTLIALENTHWQVGILPETGASTAYGRIKHNGAWVDFMRPTPPEKYDNSSDCASFLLVPWSNRIREGILRFRDQRYQLDLASDGTARHGLVRHFPWQVDSSGDDHVHLRFDSTQFDSINYPFSFQSTARFRLDGSKFIMELSIKNTDSQPFPAGIGHHPYFVRQINGEEAQVKIPADKLFELRDKMADAAPIPITLELDFRAARELGDAEIDALLTGIANNTAIRLSYPQQGIAVQLESGDIFKHVILFAPEGKPFYAVEPVSNANDGFNLHDAGIQGSGVFVLNPGEETNGVFVMTVVED